MTVEFYIRGLILAKRLLLGVGIQKAMGTRECEARRAAERMFLFKCESLSLLSSRLNLEERQLFFLYSKMTSLKPKRQFREGLFSFNSESLNSLT